MCWGQFWTPLGFFTQDFCYTDECIRQPNAQRFRIIFQLPQHDPFLQKAAAKAAAPAAKKEVDKQAQKILDEANKKADQVLVNAKVEADKKLQ